MISLTKIAAKNFKRIREDEELSDEVPLRVSVKGGGCAGYEYVLEFGKPPIEICILSRRVYPL